MEFPGSLDYDLINAGTGIDQTIKELAKTVQRVTAHEGDIIWDATKPDGTPRKLMDVSLLKKLGWSASIELEEGIQQTYKWFLNNIDDIKQVEIK